MKRAKPGNPVNGVFEEEDRKHNILWSILKNAEGLLMDWAEQNQIHINRIEFIVHVTLLQVFVFYDFDSDKERYETDGTSGKIQQLLLSYLEDLEYFSCASKKTRFEFDSNQNVLINYHGNYGLRLH